MTPPLDLAALQALCDAATPGPWVHVYGDQIRGKDEEDLVCDIYSEHGDLKAQETANAALIAAARSALPALIATLCAERAQHATEVDRITREALADTREALRAWRVVDARTNDLIATRDLCDEAMTAGLAECEHLREGLDLALKTLREAALLAMNHAAERDALRADLARVTAERDVTTRGRLALATRAERLRIAAMLRGRATAEDVRSGFTEALDEDPVGAARERGAAEALLTVALELEAQTRAEDEIAEGEGR